MGPQGNGKGNLNERGLSSMCVIIDRPAGVPIDSDLIKASVRQNSDGWGIIAPADGNLEIIKDLDNSKAVAAVESLGDRPFVFHARLATHGIKNLANCHPFEILNGMYALVHNGVFSNMPETFAGLSDTFHFAYLIVEPLLGYDPEAFDNGVLQELMESLCGWSKVGVVRASDGAAVWSNRSKGVDHEGLWLSNSGPLMSYSAKYWGDVNRTIVGEAPKRGEYRKGRNGKKKQYANAYDHRFETFALADSDEDLVITTARNLSVHDMTPEEYADFERETELYHAEHRGYLSGGRTGGSFCLADLEGYTVSEIRDLVEDEPETVVDILANELDLRGY